VKTMTTSTRSAPPPLARCFSQDQSRTQPTQKPPSPTPLRSNSFAASRRSGIVSEQDALRLAAAAAAAFDDDTRVADPRQLSRTTTSAHTGPGQWSAPVLRQQSGDYRPRPLSTGYLPTNSLETQAQQRVPNQGAQTVKADGVDAQPWLQNVALLPNRQLIQQPGTMFNVY